MVLSLLVLLVLADQHTSTGTATIKITGFDFSVAGEYPATLCGSDFALGKGMVYQAQAGEYRITIASDARASGVVPLNLKDGNVNVTAVVNGKGKNLVRHPRNGGKMTVSSDYRKAEATLELRPVVGQGTASLSATFVCK
jgi:hypothetical protein